MSTTNEPTHKRRRRGLFANDLKALLFAFGDVETPNPDTVATLDDILQEYIIDLCYEASRVSKTAHRTKIKVDDFKFAIRKDHKKISRVEELLVLQKEISDAKKIFDDKEGRQLAKKNAAGESKERSKLKNKEKNNKVDSDDD